MTVAVQTPYTETVANGSTAAFPFTFTAFAEEDLKVSLDGVEVASGFTVSGIGLATGGTVTWPSNLTAGTVVLIESRVVPERDADYSAFGGIPTDVLNLEFDRIWVALQYVLQRVKTSIKLPFTTETEPIIGSAATRALKYLGFDVSGNVSLADIPDLASTQAAQAAAEAAAATISGFENKGAWVTATPYAVNNLVREGGTTYICLLDHTSGTFATDLADVKWEIFAQKGDAGTGAGDLVAANNLSELTATAATARSNLGLGSAATKATGTAAGNVPVVGTASDTETVAGLSRRNTQAEAEAGTLDEGHMTPLKTAQAIAVLTAGIPPAGAVVVFAMNTPPTGWLKANGALVSRTTYANLFAAIGTTFGAGDGVTTFALPEVRGEFIRCWDDGRGVDSGRVFGSAQAQSFGSPVYMSGSFAAGTSMRKADVSVVHPRNVALLACIKY